MFKKIRKLFARIKLFLKARAMLKAQVRANNEIIRTLRGEQRRHENLSDDAYYGRGLYRGVDYSTRQRIRLEHLNRAAELSSNAVKVDLDNARLKAGVNVFVPSFLGFFEGMWDMIKIVLAWSLWIYVFQLAFTVPTYRDESYTY